MVANATVCALAAIAVVPALLDAILVSPHAIFIDHRTRSGQLFLVNTGTTPEEVVIDLKYGYPDADSGGMVYVRLVDQPDSSEPSAAGWLRAFPRRTVVQPGERQTVRLLAQPPAELADGEYWSRLIVTSREARPPLAAGDSAIRAGVTVELRTILAVTYRKGAVQTGITLRDFEARVTRDSVWVWMQLGRLGNAAFLGTALIEVLDAGGRTVERFRTPVAVYVPNRRRFAFATDRPLAPGAYTVRARVSTAREDLPRSSVLPAAPVADSARVAVLP